MHAIVFLFFLFASCAHSAPGTPQLRDLSSRVFALSPDWSIRTSGYRFEPVRDGNPSVPRLAERAGRKGIAFEVPTDPSGHKNRIEYKIAKAADADGLHFDNARVARFSFLLDSPSEPFLSSAILFQAWQGYPYGPPVNLKVVKGSAPPFTLKLAVRNMATGPDSAVPDLEVWSDAVIRPGVWYEIMVELEPRPAGGGHVTLWIDGVRKVSWEGAIGYDPKRVPGTYDGLDLKNGIYQPGANNGHTFYFDRIQLSSAPERSGS